MNHQSVFHDPSWGWAGWTSKRSLGSCAKENKTRIKTLLRQFARAESGASLAEYALLLVLIVLAGLAGMSLIGSSVNSFFNSLASTL